MSDTTTTLTKEVLIGRIAEDTQLSKKDVTSVVNALLDNVTSLLSHGEELRLTGFGTFHVRHRKESTARNPKTGEPIHVPACYVPVFRPGKTLKDSVNQQK